MTSDYVKTSYITREPRITSDYVKTSYITREPRMTSDLNPESTNLEPDTLAIELSVPVAGLHWIGRERVVRFYNILLRQMK